MKLYPLPMGVALAATTLAAALVIVAAALVIVAAALVIVAAAALAAFLATTLATVRILGYLDNTDFGNVDEANVICTGDGVSAIIVNGCVYTCGYGGQRGHGNLGHGDRKGRLVPTLVIALERTHIVQVSAGACHSLFVTEEGQVYSCGHGLYGQLGHGDEKTQLVPKLVVALEEQRIVQVAVGACHSLFVTEGGAVYSSGYGHYGQLGHGDEKDQLVPKLVAALDGTHIVQVAASADYSLYLTKGGSVYSSGYGHHGQLGHGDKKDQLVPKLVAALDGTHIVQVAAGDRHVLYLTKGGVVLSCGTDKYGTLAGAARPGWRRLVPKVVTALDGTHIVQVAAGFDHSLFLTKGGAVLSCGVGENMVLGHGDKKDQLVPKIVAALDGTHIVQVAAGFDHSLFLTKGSAVLSCGCGWEGQLGHGDRNNKLVPTQVTMRVP